MPVARCVMPVPENFQTGKCPFARCPKNIKRANARCPLPDYSCPLASLDMRHIYKKQKSNFFLPQELKPAIGYNI